MGVWDGWGSRDWKWEENLRCLMVERAGAANTAGSKKQLARQQVQQAQQRWKEGTNEGRQWRPDQNGSCQPANPVTRSGPSASPKTLPLCHPFQPRTSSTPPPPPTTTEDWMTI